MPPSQSPAYRNPGSPVLPLKLSSRLQRLDPAFRRDVESARRSRRNWDIDHACADESLFVFGQLFTLAAEMKEPVFFDIVSGALDSTFFDYLIDDLRLAMNSGVGVRVVILSKDVDFMNNCFAEAIDRHDNGALFYIDKQKIAPMMGFLVINDTAYRYRRHRRQAKYVANFNNSAVGEYFRSTFDRILEQCKEFSL